MNSTDFQLDRHLCFKNVSAALARQFGMKKSELEGEEFYTMVTQPCAPNFLEAALDAFRGIPVRKLRIEIVQKQRKKIDIELSLIPIETDVVEAVKGIRGNMRFLKQRVVC